MSDKAMEAAEEIYYTLNMAVEWKGPSRNKIKADIAAIIRKHMPTNIHPSVRGEKSVGGLEIVEAIRELCKGDAGEDAYIRIYPADARIINRAIGGCDEGAPEPECAAPEPKP